MSAPADLHELARRLVEMRERLAVRADRLIAEAAPALLAAKGSESETRRILDDLAREMVAAVDAEEASFVVPALVEPKQEPH